jgi:hypothetical protein
MVLILNKFAATGYFSMNPALIYFARDSPAATALSKRFELQENIPSGLVIVVYDLRLAILFPIYLHYPGQ